MWQKGRTLARPTALTASGWARDKRHDPVRRTFPLLERLLPPDQRPETRQQTAVSMADLLLPSSPPVIGTALALISEAAWWPTPGGGGGLAAASVERGSREITRVLESKIRRDRCVRVHKILLLGAPYHTVVVA